MKTNIENLIVDLYEKGINNTEMNSLAAILDDNVILFYIDEWNNSTGKYETKYTYFISADNEGLYNFMSNNSDTFKKLNPYTYIFIDLYNNYCYIDGLEIQNFNTTISNGQHITATMVE